MHKAASILCTVSAIAALTATPAELARTTMRSTQQFSITLRKDVAAAYDALKADQSRVVSVEAVSEHSSLATAERYTAAVLETCERLALFPHRGCGT